MASQGRFETTLAHKTPGSDRVGDNVNGNGSFGGGSRHLSQREHILASIFMVPMAFGLGVLFLLKIFAVETESDDDSLSEHEP